MNNTEMTQNELWYTDRKIPYSLIMRAKGTARFVNIKAITVEFTNNLINPILDIGENNPFKIELEKLLNVKIDSTNSELNFDYDRIPGKYNTIFCFEVLEHLFNPLFFLESLKKCLAKNGIIYLSTPRNGCTGLRWYYRHFNEIPDKQIKWLFDRAGLEIIKTQRIRFHEHWWELWNGGIGLRPILKYTNKTRLFKLKIKHGRMK